MSRKTRIIFHLDMDHFYTAVEERENSALKGRPVVVGADPKQGHGRGVVSTSNYKAREAGVKSGMPISRAWHVCPEAVYLPPNFPLYIKVSNAVMEIAEKYADKFEQWGIDEAFLDVSGRVRNFNEAETLAKRLKQEIKEKECLTASIGVGPNKLVAKIASDIRKPDGLSVVRENEVETFLSPLPVRKLLWVGKKTEAKLKLLGIETVGDLARFDPAVLNEMFGVMGVQLHLAARGIDNSEVEQRTGVKSISHETTFEEDTDDLAVISAAVEALCDDVAKETREQKLFFKNVTIKVRYQNFETHTYAKSLSFQTNRAADLRKTAKELLKTNLEPGRKVRLLGVRASNFVMGEKQTTLL